MKLLIVKMVGVMLAGMYDESEDKFDLVLHTPRMIFADPEAGVLSLSKCIGNPKELLVEGDIQFRYLNEDTDFAEFYVQETTDPVDGMMAKHEEDASKSNP